MFFLIAMETSFETILQQSLQSLETIKTLEEVEVLYASLFGKKGTISLLLQQVKDLTPDQKPIRGKQINDLKSQLLSAFNQKRSAFIAQDTVVIKDVFDSSLPGVSPILGHFHPNSLIMKRVKTIFSSLGFLHAEGPEVESDWYNFEVLNMPKTHPARDTQDTFYLTGNQLLRTQTSAVQVRVMEKQKPPVRIYSIGKVFRRDYDLTHTPMFHQVEGLVVDTAISLTDLKGVMTYMMKALFGPDTKIRLRPHHFPYTEPSVEQDISCPFCRGDGCRVCKQTGWIELGGAGMVHPQVLRNVGYDPEKVSGFAFGFGIDRVAMIKYSIPDLRLLFENDWRFLQQF